MHASCNGKAKNAGTGWVSVRNTNHFGIAGYHAMMALEHDMIGMAMTNASALLRQHSALKECLVQTRLLLLFLQISNRICCRLCYNNCRKWQT
jgi:LDH2 family malate/lactate/ureidoglycolate dehydrogenase